MWSYTSEFWHNKKLRRLPHFKSPEMIVPVQHQSPLNDNLETEPSQLPCLFSIVIPVRNEEENIRICLDSVRRMKFAPEQFEVIVVDNGSTDRTKEVASTFREFFSL